MPKKQLPAPIILMLLFALAACGGNTTTPASAPTEAPSVVATATDAPEGIAAAPVADDAATDTDLLAPAGVPNATYYAPFPVTIALDGELHDWAGVPTVVIPDPDAIMKWDTTMTFAAAADDDPYLYMMANVVDSNIISGEHGGDYWNEDSVEFYVNAAGDLGLTSNRPFCSKSRWPRSTPGSPLTRPTGRISCAMVS